MIVQKCLLAAFVFVYSTSSFAQQNSQFTVEKSDTEVTVKLNEKLFTKYLVKSGAKPILFPVIGPADTEMTRSFPIADAKKDERQDHVHHRSFWFTHGNVDGISFWHENDKHGNIVHQSFEKVEGGDTAVIVTKNNWIGPDKKIHCSDVRNLTFGAADKIRWIDFDIKITAGKDGCTFGDTKEGSFGIRVAGSLKVDAKSGGKITNKEGANDKAAWGKPSAWVDYSGKVDGKECGITILNHPQSYGYPTHWHVRTYGLFAANPFGLRDFYGKDSKKNGSLQLKAGESFGMSYRVIFHEGTFDGEKIKRLFSEYEKVKKDAGAKK